MSANKRDSSPVTRRAAVPTRALEFDYVAVDRLRPLPGHPRKLPKSHIERIAASIRTIGWINPVIIDEHNNVVAGYGRLLAAQALKLKEVPTVRASGMSEADKRAYRIAENRLAEIGGWDNDLLAAEFTFLFEASFEFEVTGFDMGDIDALFAVDADDDHDDVHPIESVAVTRPGDLWTIGAHRVLCGDALNPDAITRLLGGDRADMVFTDPPYNVAIGGNVAGIRAVAHREFAMASGEMNAADFTAFLTGAMQAIAGNSRAGAIVYVCMDWRHMRELSNAAEAAGLQLKQLCVWNKTNAGMGSFYRSQHELVFVFKLPGGTHVNNFGFGGKGRNRTNVWTYAGANGFRKGRSEDLALHPTVKPVAMVADAILDCSKRGDIVLDVFGGSGTTLVAAAKTGRRGYALELDPRYVDCIVRRIEQQVGVEATLDDGVTFAAASRQRSIGEAA